MAPARSRSPQRPKTSSVGNVLGSRYSERNCIIQCVCLVHWPDNAVTERTNGNQINKFARTSKYLQGHQIICENIKIFERMSKFLQEYQNTYNNIKILARTSTYLQEYQNICNNIKIFGRTSKCLQEYQKTCNNINIFARNSKRKKVFREILSLCCCHIGQTM